MVYFHYEGYNDGVPLSTLEGMFARYTGASGAQVAFGPLVYNPLTELYTTTLLTDLAGADETLGPGANSDLEVAASEADFDAYDVQVALSRPSRTLRRSLKWVDPTGPNSDGYTP